MKEYFKSDADYTALMYVRRAVSKDPIKPSFCCIYIENKDGVCYAAGSDSRRLHLAELSVWVEDGLYRIVKADAKSICIEKSTDDLQYPNIWRVIPKLDSFDATEIIKESKITSHADIIFPVFKHGVKANPQYLIDAVVYEGTAYLNSKDTMTPILIKCSTLTGVVMPIQEKK